MSNELAIAELQGYKDIVGRIKVLETFSWSGGILLKTINNDDRLQELHRKLRGKRSYMYLNQHELQIEQTAHAYLERYPAGTRAQLAEVKQCVGADPDDDKLLRELERKIRKVIDIRGNNHEDGTEQLIDQISELQDLQAEKQRIDNVLDIMAIHHDHLSKLLRLRYMDGLRVDDVAAELGIVPRTYRRWHLRAIEQYAKLSGI